jgi:hypothetical protein
MHVQCIEVHHADFILAGLLAGVGDVTTIRRPTGIPVVAGEIVDDGAQYARSEICHPDIELAALEVPGECKLRTIRRPVGIDFAPEGIHQQTHLVCAITVHEDDVG